MTTQPARNRIHWLPLAVMASVGLALLAFFIYSQLRPPIPFGTFLRPPLYGYWDPTLHTLALLVVPAGLLVAAIGWLFTSGYRIPAWLGIVLLVISGVATAAAIGVVRGEPSHLTRGVATDPTSPYYTSDLHFVDEYGIRGFVEQHPRLTTQFRSYASKTHPPGAHLFLYALFGLFGASNPLQISTAIAVIAVSGAAATWAMGRTLGGERAGRIGAALFVAAPGPLLLAYTSMDAIFATVLATAVALFMLAIKRQSAQLTFLAGAVLGIATLMTFSSAFVAIAAALAMTIKASSTRVLLSQLGAAAAGGLAVLVIAHLVLNFDLLASYQAVPDASQVYDPYWALASPAAWLTWAGLPVAGLGLMGLVSKVSDSQRPVLAIILMTLMVVWVALPSEVTKLRPGEVERTWAFLYPVLAAVAGTVASRWTQRSERWAGSIVAALIVISIGQAVMLQALWDNLF